MVSPEAVCAEGKSTLVAIKGQALSPLNDSNLNTSLLELPQVTLERTQDLTGAAVSDSVVVPNDPQKPSAGDEEWTDQQDMAFTVCPPGTCSTQTPPLTDYTNLPTGLYSIQVQNRNGKSTTLPNALTLVPKPVVTRVDADLLCEDKDNDVTITGDWILRVNGMLGFLDIGGSGGKSFPITAVGNCRKLPSASDITVEACTTATVHIPGGSFQQGTYPISARGPSPVDCASTQDTNAPVTITFVRSPKLLSVVPDLICDAQMDRDITLNGADFLTVDGTNPVIHVGTKDYAPTTVSGCQSVTGPGLREVVQQCTTLTFTIKKGDLDAMNYGVTVTNPKPADCTTMPAVDLTVVPPPVLTSVMPDLACDAQGPETVTLVGSGFLYITANGSTSGPMVTLMGGGVSMMLPAKPVSASCTMVTGPTENPVLSCAMVTVSVSGLPPGAYGFNVTNPEPAGCSSTNTVTFVVTAPPVVQSVQPAGICAASASAVPITVTGTGFLTVNGTAPSVSFTPTGAGSAFTVAPPNVTASGCAPVTLGQTEMVQSCTTLTVNVPKSAVALGQSFKVAVSNPPPAGCTSQEMVAVVGEPPPTLTSVSDGVNVSPPGTAILCQNGGTLTLTGTNLPPGARVTVSKPGGGVGSTLDASMVVGGSGCTGTPAECTSVVATFGPGLATGSGYSVTVQTAPDAACTAGPVGTVKVVTGPLVVFADPQLVYNKVAISMTVYAANVTGTIQKVVIANQATGQMRTFCNTGAGCDGTVSAPSSGRAVVTLPAGLDPGSWSVTVFDQGGSCNTAFLADAFMVTAIPPNLTATITPSFGYVGEDVAVTIKVDKPLDSAPRVYLSSASLTSAVALKAVALTDAMTITAIIPANSLTAGDYDLIVTGQSGGATVVALTTKAYHANANPTPVITSLDPPDAITSQAITFNILGRNFSTSATVSLPSCQPAGFTVPPLAVTVNSSSSISVTTTFSSVGVCTVRVTNPDGAFFDFASISVSNPASKLTNTTQLPNLLTVGRRAPGAAVANATPAARFVYAAGGDGGSEASALSSVESTPVDLTGALSGWTLQRYGMVHKRTFVGLVNIGRFLYAVGGSSGAGALSTVERAAVLDPLRVVNVSDLEVDPSAAGLKGGTWLYRIAPVMDATDPFNPANAGTPQPEGLAGETFTVLLPSVKSGGLKVTLIFNPLPGGHVDHYNIYRNADQSSTLEGSEVLIGSTAAGTGNAATQMFADDGIAPTSTQKPLPIGSTGAWTSSEDALGIVKTMATARSGAGVTALQDPADPTVYWLYALAGNTASEAAPSTVASYELAKITVAADGSQTMSAWSNGATALPLGARWQLGAYGLTFRYTIAMTAGATTSNTAAYVFAGSGAGASGTEVGVVKPGSGQLTTDGTTNGLTTLSGSASMPAVQGYGSFAAPMFAQYQQVGTTTATTLLSAVNGYLFELAGVSGGTVSNGSTQTVVLAPGQSGGTASVTIGAIPPPPKLKGWSNSASLVTARNLPVAVDDNGFIFVIGGGTSATPQPGTALNTVESTIF